MQCELKLFNRTIAIRILEIGPGLATTTPTPCVFVIPFLTSIFIETGITIVGA